MNRRNVRNGMTLFRWRTQFYSGQQTSHSPEYGLLRQAHVRFLFVCVCDDCQCNLFSLRGSNDTLCIYVCLLLSFSSLILKTFFSERGYRSFE